ncbi:hypothetical protein CQW23_04251 [Capsicum baccatum]|uniref:Protein kinase domain-containing protein n=1 Tax=Capsicum baccatum TaxID=33114 RepID=A0A2G2XE46_CAPBA|nr:hypothetical protein CQW23_04251 [Capsicum baccatum]
MSMKFDIEKFDGKISFAIWRVQMLAVLTQNGLKKVLSGKSAKPATTTEEQWEEMDEKALSIIQLCLSREVLREVINEKTAAGIWSKLESLYMTKSLANKLRLKERLFTLRMSEGTPIQSHLGEFNSIIIDLENLDVEIDDEDKAVLLIVSLPPSYRHFKKIMLYGNNVTLSFDDVKSNLLSKEKFDTQIHSESSGEGLVVKWRNHKVGASGKNQSKSRGLCGNPQKHVPACPSNSKNRSKSKNRRLIWIIVASSVISVIGFASAIVFVLMRRRGKTVNVEDERSPEVAPQRISYYELQRATQGFDANNLLGSGSFGSVYKGTLADGMTVAVKVFNVQMEGTFQTFDRECEILRNLRHRNLTKIISSCCNLDFKALILEYMPNESLDRLLYFRDYCLNIMQRLNIMVDVASALKYLHHGYSVPLIHCDLKPSNVLLDKDMYGLEGLISKRSDVYSFGIVLLETFIKKKPTDEMFAGDLNLRSWVHKSLPEELDQILDADLLILDEQNLSQKSQCMSSIMELAMKCTANIPVERMNMTNVVASLKKIKQKLSFCY